MHYQPRRSYGTGITRERHNDSGGASSRFLTKAFALTPEETCTMLDARFGRHLADDLSFIKGGPVTAEAITHHFERVRITETIELTAREYDAFTNGFLKDRSWLAGKGGVMNGFTKAIAVTAPERTTLYVNPEGYSYARYIGISLNEITH